MGGGADVGRGGAGGGSEAVGGSGDRRGAAGVGRGDDRQGVGGRGAGIAGRGVECEAHVDAGVRRVWELVTDIELSVRFSEELRRVRWLGGASSPALGARFEGYNHNPMLGDWRTVSHVVDLSAPHTFAWAVVDPDGRFGDTAPDPTAPAATWRFTLTPDGDGTLVRYAVRFGSARSGLTLAVERFPDRAEAIVAGRLDALRASMARTLDGIKAIAEGPTVVAGPA
ncbi:Polyketide cyclase / dehydrase and lipid transport [Actinokineospora iranica]|uniref:Polyketide cyclase / dehydrase and lipid transport n=2 Tax=Actinokineospora iranica TaxID=1271860 RepID=A0A1G6Z1I8_9PSEU|nr:Polyketide cyclase / dehydrase and lipid transport [Actinokineospora iranica]